jgi:hypothetical protein
MGFVENVNVIAQGLTADFIQDISDVRDMQGILTTVSTNIADVNTVADDLNLGSNSKIGTVSANIADVSTVAANASDIEVVVANMADVNSIVDTVIPNITEILAADDNAAIATAQAGIATAQAAVATTKASEASVSAAAALEHETQAAMILDQFDDRYLGSKDVDPLLDNDGNALLVGALYFNTVVNKMRVWDGTIWADSLTLTAGSVSVLTNKTIDDISNLVGANHIHYPVRNITASVIPAGTVVHAHATQPGTDYITVEPLHDPTTDVALGITHSAIAVNGVGLVLNTGISSDMINTSGWAVGTILYPTAGGGLTSTKPTVGQYQTCAVVLRSHSTQGTLLCEFTEPKYIASTSQSGYVQLNDTLTSTSTVQALTAAQGKALNDRLTTVETGTVQEGDSVTLTGDVTGTATFDANGNVSVTTTVVDDSHNHIIANVDGLQTALDGKQPLDTTLTALAGVATAADKYIYATGSDTFTTGTITSFGRSLVDDTDASTARATLGVTGAEKISTAAVTSVTFNADGTLTIVTP